MIRIRPALALAAVTAALAGCATAPREPEGCATALQVEHQVLRFRSLQPLPNPPATLTPAAAQCSVRKFVAALETSHGRVIGYKAGLTNPAVQKRFGLDAPLRGTLLEKMMLKSGAEVPAKFGARPFLEPDLVVEVGSSAIHDAKTPLEALASLRAVVPFIELPDTVVEDPSKINAPTLIAINVGARLGVLGTPIPLEAGVNWVEALRDMTVRTTDNTGKEIGAAKGPTILGHPLNAVIWLAGELKKDGITLKPGDLLSLGAFGQGSAEAGKTVTVRYEGLPGNPAVSVTFR